MESRPMNDDEVKHSIIDRDKLPPLFPTHRHSPEFWEQLGRTIATYGFLEDVLGKAIFAFTATRNYSPDEIDAAYQAWLPQLERALTDQLWNLAESYGKAARGNPATTTENVDELIEDIKKATVIRNVLCHGSWRQANADGASVPLFVNRQKQSVRYRNRHCVFGASSSTCRRIGLQRHRHHNAHGMAVSGRCGAG
jgi:hypothetical protein